MQRRPSLVPDLFHVKRTTVTQSPPSICTEICGTYTDLDAAQKAGLRRLDDEGHHRSSLAEYAENDVTEPPSTSWPHGENVIVHARKGDEVHTVDIETTPNSLGVRSKPEDGRVQDNLFYVLCTVQARGSGGSVKTEIRGIHLSRQAAVAAARYELVSGERTQDWYVDYKEEVGLVPQEEDDEGSQVIVRATGKDGEKYVVSVTHES